MALLILSTATAVTASSEGNILLDTTTEQVVAYDPLDNVADQLMVPVVAGVPPPPLLADHDKIQTLKVKEQRYIQRIETERVEKQGSLYVELTPDELRTSGEGRAYGKIRLSGEPLPWDGMDDDELGEEENGLGDDYFAQGSYSHWGGEFRYETFSEGDNEDETSSDSKDTDRQSRQLKESRMASKQTTFSAKQADQDDGAEVADEQTSRLELEILPAKNEPTRDLKVEETGEAVETLDPNVKNNVKEIVEPQIWDADGKSQKAQGRVDRGKQEYVQMQEDPSIKVMNVARVSDYETEKRPKLDQIDMMGYEAEVDWLNEQDKMFKSWRHRHHHQANKHFDADWDPNSVEEEEQLVGDDAPVDPAKSPEEMFNDPLWHVKHGKVPISSISSLSFSCNSTTNFFLGILRRSQPKSLSQARGNPLSQPDPQREGGRRRGWYRVPGRPFKSDLQRDRLSLDPQQPRRGLELRRL